MYSLSNNYGSYDFENFETVGVPNDLVQTGGTTHLPSVLEGSVPTSPPVFEGRMPSGIRTKPRRNFGSPELKVSKPAPDLSATPEDPKTVILSNMKKCGKSEKEFLDLVNDVDMLGQKMNSITGPDDKMAFLMNNKTVNMVQKIVAALKKYNATDVMCLTNGKVCSFVDMLNVPKHQLEYLDIFEKFIDKYKNALSDLASLGKSMSLELSDKCKTSPMPMIKARKILMKLGEIFVDNPNTINTLERTYGKKQYPTKLDNVKEGFSLLDDGYINKWVVLLILVLLVLFCVYTNVLKRPFSMRTLYSDVLSTVSLGKL
jgi:hypothetical protein